MTAGAAPERWTRIGGALGSTAGGLFLNGSGNKFYAKFPSAEGQIYAEQAADLLYELMGVETMRHAPAQIEGRAASASKWKKVVPLGRGGWGKLTDKQLQQAACVFVASVLVKNWDVVGDAYDNTGLTRDRKLAIIDSGGSFRFRARGEPKPYEVDALPDLLALQDPRFPAGAMFRPLLDVHGDKFVAAARTLQKIPDAELRKCVEPMKDRALGSALVERKKVIVEYFCSTSLHAPQRAATSLVAATPPLTLFHYTHLERLPSIYAAGALRGRDYSLNSRRSVPLVWFSARDPWEPAAGKRAAGEKETGSFEEQQEKFGCARFRLASPLPTISWREAASLCEYGADRVAILEDCDPDDLWRCSLVEVPLSCLEFEVFFQGRWIPASLEEAAEALSNQNR